MSRPCPSQPSPLSPGASCRGTSRAARPAAPSRALSTSGKPCRRRTTRRRGRRGWASRRRPPLSAVVRGAQVDARSPNAGTPNSTRAWLWSKTKMRVSGWSRASCGPRYSAINSSSRGDGKHSPSYVSVPVCGSGSFYKQGAGGRTAGGRRVEAGGRRAHGRLVASRRRQTDPTPTAPSSPAP